MDIICKGELEIKEGRTERDRQSETVSEIERDKSKREWNREREGGFERERE